MSISITEAQKYSEGGESVVYMPEQILSRKATKIPITKGIVEVTKSTKTIMESKIKMLTENNMLTSFKFKQPIIK